MISNTMLNTPTATSATPSAGTSPSASTPDAASAFAALLTESAVVVAETMAGSATPAAAAPTASAPVAPSESGADALPQVLEQLAMAAPKAPNASPVPAEEATPPSVALLPGLTAPTQAAEPADEGGAEGEDSPTREDSADATLAIVDVSAMLGATPPSVTGTLSLQAATGNVGIAAATPMAASNTQLAAGRDGSVASEDTPTSVAQESTGEIHTAKDDATRLSLLRPAQAETAPQFARALEHAQGTVEGVSQNTVGAANGAGTILDIRGSQPAARPTVLPQVEMPADPAAGFDDTLGARMSVAIDRGISHARIRISPEHLGAIDLHVALDGDKVTAQFHSQHADVRTAIEGSLARLRDHLADQGLQLTGAQVSGQGAGTGHGASEQQSRQPQAFGLAELSGGADSAAAIDVPAPAVRSTGLVDEYA